MRNTFGQEYQAYYDMLQLRVRARDVACLKAHINADLIKQN